MLKPIFIALLSFFLPFSGSFSLFNGIDQKTPKQDSGTLEKMIVSNGTVTMDVDLNRLNGRSGAKQEGPASLRFDVEKNAFFTVMVFDGELRGPLPGSMGISPKDSAIVPAKLEGSYDRLVLEKAPWDEHFEFVIRDVKSGFRFFNVEGHLFDYNADDKVFRINNGRILIAPDFAAEMGRPDESGTVVGELNVKTTMRTIEVLEIVDGQVESSDMPALNSPEDGTVPGPDVVVGDVYGLAQFGSSGTKVGLAVGTNSCNFGTENLNWNRLPSNDHPVIPQNLYRMSGGADNQERFEQIGQSSVKHAFTALTGNICNLGCNGIGGSRLGSGCSDPYSAGLNAGPNLGSRAWINPFNGAYPRGDSATPPNNHGSHSHDSTSHRILTEAADLNTQNNAGARYFAEGQYITPHEYAWCQSNPGECNMYNNVSYREYSVNGTTSFSFSPVSSTVRMKPAIEAWPGATFVGFEPDQGNDGIGQVAYKVTQTSPGVWHYEYAVYNQNLDRAIQMFNIPLGSGITLSNVGFYAPPQHPGWAEDGTASSAGFSSTPWTQNLTTGNMEWTSETFAQNANANAIRWGTMYNFRFDSNRPPQTVNATIGFFKTGAPIMVAVQGPTPASVAAVSVSGRVTGPTGRGVRSAQVSITDGAGVRRTVLTNHFGNYRITGIPAGSLYTISADAKGLIYPPQMIQVDDHLTGINFSISN